MTSLFERLQKHFDTAKNIWAGKEYFKFDPKWSNPDINVLKSLINFQADVVEGEYGIWGEPWIPKEILPHYIDFLDKYSSLISTSTEVIRSPFVAMNFLQLLSGINGSYYSEKYPTANDLGEEAKRRGETSQTTGNTLGRYQDAYNGFFNHFKIQNIANQRNFSMVPDVIGSTNVNGKDIYNVLPYLESPSVGQVHSLFSNISALSLEFLKPNLIREDVQQEFLVASAAPIFMPTGTMTPAPMAYILREAVAGTLMKCLGVNGEICSRYFAAKLLKSTPGLVSSVPIKIAGKAILNAGAWTSLVPYLGVVVAVVIFIIIIIKATEDEKLKLIGDLWLFDESRYLETIFVEVSGNSKDVKEELTEYIREYSHLSNPQLFLLDEDSEPILGVNGSGEISKQLMIQEFNRLASIHDLHFENNLWGRGKTSDFEEGWLI